MSNTARSDPAEEVLKLPIEGHLVKARKAGDAAELQKMVWRAVRAAEQMMFQTNATPELVFKAIYALSQIGGTYLKIIETHDLQEQITGSRTNWRRSATA